jgi:hypothetical protein
MDKSVWTMPRPPGGMVAGLEADRSKPADKTEPFLGRVASSESFLTRRGSSDMVLLLLLMLLMLLLLLLMILLLLLLLEEEEEKSNTDVERGDEKMLFWQCPLLRMEERKETKGRNRILYEKSK